MNKPARNLILGVSLAALSLLSLAADQAAGSAQSSAPEAATTNVATPTTKAAKKVVKRSHRAIHVKHVTKKPGM
jgi:hypothetical protein